MSQTAAYGSWRSPITSDLVATASVALSSVVIDGTDIYWLESRPTEGGRYTVIQRSPDGSMNECTPYEFNVRTTVHEYGGGAFTVADGVIYFVNYHDQRLYRQPVGVQPTLLTPTDGCRYADMIVDQERGRLICIREDHRSKGEAVNAIVALNCHDVNDGRLLASGNDFYSSPKLSPDGTQLAYLTWNHPNMPWDGCELWVAVIEEHGGLIAQRRIAGGPRESIFQPEWSPDGALYFASDHSGWWNLHRWDGKGIEALYPMEAEFGRAQFQFGMSVYGFVSPYRILCTYSQNGSWHLAWLETTSRRLTSIGVPFTEVSDVRCGNGFGVFIVGSAQAPTRVVQLQAESGQLLQLKETQEGEIGSQYFSVPEVIDFQTGGGLTSHGFYYPPHNPDQTSMPGELPPLLVTTHGGPTSAANSTLSYAIQFWTSRGFGVLDVNYGGSTGYGRAYRQRLYGKWGVVDVEDSCNGALHLAQTGRVDRARMAVRGRSAGGYTTLACLTFRNEVFAAGCSLYGLSDLETFVRDTHKFEAQYLTSLIGPYPERRDLYFQRSPIHFITDVACPLILLQGDEDKVVPPNQAQSMFEALRAHGTPVALLVLPGEQHGFRRSENIKRALEAELYFYSRVFGFTPADPIEGIRIENL